MLRPQIKIGSEFIATCFITLLLLALAPISNAVSHDEKMEHIAKQSSAQMRKTISIAVLAHEDMVLQDFAGPVEVFAKASNLTHGKYKVFTVGLDDQTLMS